MRVRAKVAIAVGVSVNVFLAVLLGTQFGDWRRRAQTQAKLLRIQHDLSKVIGFRMNPTDDPEIHLLKLLDLHEPPPLSGRRWRGRSLDEPSETARFYGQAANRQDDWGRWIRYRSPGVVHTRGWDLWSCGPNGIDELGHGDDILIGDDAPQ